MTKKKVTKKTTAKAVRVKRTISVRSVDIKLWNKFKAEAMAQGKTTGELLNVAIKSFV